MGSIVTAMEFGKPIVIMPRDHERGEHRNGHQMATAQRFMDTPGVYVAMNKQQLAIVWTRLERWKRPRPFQPRRPSCSPASCAISSTRPRRGAATGVHSVSADPERAFLHLAALGLARPYGEQARDDEQRDL